MVLLVLETGGARYGVPASRIIEVVPAPVLRRLPGTPAFVAGVFSYHGTPVPVIDLSILLNGPPARPLFSTRILLVRMESALVGFLAEHATDTISCRREDFQTPGVRADGAPSAGDILVRPDGLIQILEVDRALTAELEECLAGRAAVQV